MEQGSCSLSEWFPILPYSLPWLTSPSLNGDGRDDYVWVDPKTGDVHGWINRLSSGGVWQWEGLGRIAGGVGATNETLQMVDIDGK